MLNQMNRNGGPVEIEIEDGEQQEENGDPTTKNKSKKKKKMVIDSNAQGNATLEKPENFTLQSFDLAFEADPMFKKMSAEFDDPSIKKMMQNRLGLDSNLSYALDLSENQNELFSGIKTTTKLEEIIEEKKEGEEEGDEIKGEEEEGEEEKEEMKEVKEEDH